MDDAKKLRGLDPREMFYLPISVDNDDGSLDIGSEGREGFSTVKEAIDFAKDDVDDSGAEYFIYECRPIKRIHRIAVMVEDI